MSGVCSLLKHVTIIFEELLKEKGTIIDQVLSPLESLFCFSQSTTNVFSIHIVGND